MPHQPSTTDTNNDRRTTLLRKNIIYSFLIKGWTGLVYLLIVPITLKCIGEYENGVWLTISSLLVLIDNLDIGLGNGLRNNLAIHIANNDVDRARTVVSNTFIMLICIILPTLAVLIFLTLHVDTYSFFNVDAAIVNDLDATIVISLVFICTTFVFKFIGNVYQGLQLPAVSNLLVALGYTFSLIGIYVLYYCGLHSLWMIALVNTASPLVVYLLLYPYTFIWRYPMLRPRLKDFHWHTAKGLFSMGIKFFSLQMCSAVMFMSSSLLLSRLFSPQTVTPYQIAYRYLSIVLHAFTVIGNPYWSATTDAFTRGNLDWIRQAANGISRIVVICVATLFVFVLISGFVYDIWIGSDVHVPLTFTIGMAAYLAMNVYSLAYCYFLNGMGFLHVQLICTVGGLLLFLLLAYAITSITNNPSSILLALCLASLPSFACNRVQFHKIINNKATGIWTR